MPGILLDNNLYVKNVEITYMGHVRIITSKTFVEHREPECFDMVGIINHFTEQHASTVMASNRNKKYHRQITSMKRHIENLKKECRQPRINGNKVDSIKKEIENIAKNLPDGLCQ